MLNNYEVCSKTGASTDRRVGKCKKNKPIVKYTSGSGSGKSSAEENDNILQKWCDDTDSETREEEEEKEDKKVSWIINALPKKYKAKAFSLLRYISRNYNMKWTPDGTFKNKNKIIPKSNILHLVLHALLKIYRRKTSWHE